MRPLSRSRALAFGLYIGYCAERIPLGYELKILLFSGEVPVVVIRFVVAGKEG